MTTSERTTIEAVIRTLDSIQVQGYENMNRILGCASALQGLLQEGDHGMDNNTSGD